MLGICWGCDGDMIGIWSDGMEYNGTKWDYKLYTIFYNQIITDYITYINIYTLW
jgi:hypothetical protein